MTLGHEDREQLSRNYLTKSQDTIKTVDFLIKNGEFSLAMNRMEGDYNVFASFEKQEIATAFNEMRQVIIRISEMFDEA